MKSKYKGESIFKVLEQINKTIFVPDIQRDYCWDSNDVIDLLKSILDGFPIGTFIFWEVNGEVLNSEDSPNIYKFLSKTIRTKTGRASDDENELMERQFDMTQKYQIVLDGQQRLTSLYLVFNGHYSFKNSSNDPVEKYLCYMYNWSEDSKGNKIIFKFLTRGEQNKFGNECYCLQDMKKYINNYKGFLTDIEKLETTDANKKNLKKLFNALYYVQHIHYYRITSKKFDDALNIFVKVNSTGKKLNKTDLLYGSLINNWTTSDSNSKGRRDEIEKFLRKIKNDYKLNIDKDFLLRICLVLANEGTSGVSINELKKHVPTIRDFWEKGIIQRDIEDCYCTLQNIGLCEDTVTASNAIIPIVYYFHKNRDNKCLQLKTDPDIRTELRKYFAIAFTKGLFGGSSDTAITNTCKLIDKHVGEPFSVSFLTGTISNGKDFHVDIKWINQCLTNIKKGQRAFFPLSLFGDYDFSNTFDQDHTHPKKLFTKKHLKEIIDSYDDTKIDLWIEARDCLPNLNLLRKRINRVEKNDMPLDEWINKDKNNRSYIAMLPKNISYNLSNFEEYYTLRRSLIKYRLCEIFGVEREEILFENDGEVIEVTINKMVPQSSENSSTIECYEHGRFLRFVDDSKQKAEVEIKKPTGQTIIAIVPTEYLYIVEAFDKKLEC